MENLSSSGKPIPGELPIERHIRAATNGKPEGAADENSEDATNGKLEGATNGKPRQGDFIIFRMTLVGKPQLLQTTTTRGRLPNGKPRSGSYPWKT